MSLLHCSWLQDLVLSIDSDLIHPARGLLPWNTGVHGGAVGILLGLGFPRLTLGITA